MPLMERYGIPGTARASFGVYNTTDEIDAFINSLRRVVAEAVSRTRPVTVPAVSLAKSEPAFPAAAAASPQEAADEIAEVFDFLDSWQERYEYLIEMGDKLPPLPDEYKSEANRIHGCQSTVFLEARKKPGTADVLEFLAYSDAAIVRGELALLQRLYSGQRAKDVVAFNVEQFFERLGLDRNLSMGRRNGLAEMVKRVRSFAAPLAK
jgi:cysteine desulfurase/selenocysteine lyase